MSAPLHTQGVAALSQALASGQTSSVELTQTCWPASPHTANWAPFSPPTPSSRCARHGPPTRAAPPARPAC
jgi:hypothetical protein